MENRHINRVKEKILRILSIGANRTGDNIHPPGHKGRNSISSPLEEEMCYRPEKGASRTSTLAPSLHQPPAYSLPRTEGGVARLIS